MTGRAGMRWAAGLMLLAAAPAAAAPFDDLKEAYAACLRYEAGAGGRARTAPSPDGAAALARCAAEGERLERADPRRLRDGYGLSPSSWQVIEAVFGPGQRRRLAGLVPR